MLEVVRPHEIKVGPYTVQVTPLPQTIWPLYRVWVGDTLALSQISYPSLADIDSAVASVRNPRKPEPSKPGKFLASMQAARPGRPRKGQRRADDVLDAEAVE